MPTIPESAGAQAAALAAGEVSSVVLVEAVLDAVARRNPTLHAVCSVEPELALAEAAASDARRRAGAPLSPVDGVPMLLKDGVRARGHRTTWGDNLFRFHRSSSDSAVVAALRGAGLVVVGRTAVPTALLDWNCRNAVYAECVNPHDPTRVPGGSSGGSAAALAAGLARLDLGSDLGGSIRYPAHCCGVFGLRTTDGWLPTHDLGPPGLPGAFSHLAVVGPMAPSLDDLALLLGVLGAAFPAPRVPLPDGPLAVSWRYGTVEPEPAVVAALERFVRDLDVVEAAPPLDPAELWEAWGLVAGYELGQTLPVLRAWPAGRDAYGWLAVERRLGAGPFADHFRAGLRASEARYQAAVERLAAIHAQADPFFARHRAWLLPVAPGPALPLGAGGRPVPHLGQSLPYSRYLGEYTVPTTALGTPALAGPLPVDGVPLGVQVHARRGADLALVEAARAWWAPPLGPLSGPR